MTMVMPLLISDAMERLSIVAILCAMLRRDVGIAEGIVSSRTAS